MNKTIKLLKRNNFTFDEASHTYQLDGQLLTGVTTILKVRAQDWMQFWRAKAMYNALLPQIDKAQGISMKGWEGMLIEAKNAGNRKSKDALEAGSIAHDWIEAYVKEKIAGTESNKQFPEDQKAASAIHAFLDWEQSHEVQWLLSEEKMCSPIHMIGGTVDAVAVIDGVLTVMDFKTSSQVSEDVALQTAAYHILLGENIESGEVPSARAVLRIPKDGGVFEYQIIKTDLSFDRKIFIALREVHRWNTYIQNNFTEGGSYSAKVKLDKEKEYDENEGCGQCCRPLEFCKCEE